MIQSPFHHAAQCPNSMRTEQLKQSLRNEKLRVFWNNVTPQNSYMRANCSCTPDKKKDIQPSNVFALEQHQVGVAVSVPTFGTPAGNLSALRTCPFYHQQALARARRRHVAFQPESTRNRGRLVAWAGEGG
jgi:hypothetical protein